MAYFNIVNGWPVRVPKAEWTEADWDVFLGSGGNSRVLDNHLCTLLADARRQGYRRARIDRNTHGYALYDTNVSTGRISPIFASAEQVAGFAARWIAEDPGKRSLVE